jgi:hypothetical protein
MQTKTLIFGGLAAGGGGAAYVLARRFTGDGQTDGKTTDRWHVVTVNRSREELVPDGRLPGPLAELGDMIEVQIRRAAGDRGTELAARWRGPVPAGPAEAVAKLTGDDPRERVRIALRHSKMLAETGEILSPDKPPSTRRTLKNVPLELATRRARGEGRL